MHAKRLARFIAALQQKEEHVRRRWLIGLSIGTMALVTTVWISSLKRTTGAPAPTPREYGSEEPGATEIFIAGLRVVASKAGERSRELSRSLQRAMSRTKEINVLGNEKNFMLEGLEAVPPTPLP